MKHSLIVSLVLLAVAVRAQVNFKSSNLPIIVIDTHGQTIPDEPKITADMGIINNGAGNINHVTDAFNDYNGKIGIELRGSSSQSFPKKPYGLEVRDASGAAIDASLLGMPAKDDWILFAAYDDKSLMRDALAYHLGRAQGRYASRVRYCELVLNGNYQGVYVLLEKIKRDKNRVNIAKLTTTDISGDDVTGGYIIKIDKTTGSGGSDGWASAFPPLNRSNNQYIYFLYDYPQDVDIVSQQKSYIQQYVNNFEVALSSSNFKDPINGYAKYIDVGSFVDFMLMMEVTKNADGYRLSTFLYKDKDSKGGKLSMGPIWDFNEGFGNVDYCTQGNPEGFVTNFNYLCNGDYWLIPFWWDQFFKDPAFVSRVASRWTELRNGPFKTQAVLDHIDSIANVLTVDSAQQRNFVRWPVLGTYVWPNYYVGQTFVDEVNWLKNWVTQRMIWLDANLPQINTAVEPVSAASSVEVYPNPFTSSFTIQYKSKTPSEAQFEFYDLMGNKLVGFSKTSGDNGLQQVDYTLSAPAGCYILKARVENEVSYTKVIKN
ncbi:MAG: CotH kinase family protein [Bacteroidetes bacterium]|nr:CotH kinase family protein [Bacteroidota bacterium]